MEKRTKRKIAAVQGGSFLSVRISTDQGRSQIVTKENILRMKIRWNFF